MYNCCYLHYEKVFGGILIFCVLSDVISSVTKFFKTFWTFTKRIWARSNPIEIYQSRILFVERERELIWIFIHHMKDTLKTWNVLELCCLFFLSLFCLKVNEFRFQLCILGTEISLVPFMSYKSVFHPFSFQLSLVPFHEKVMN